MRRPLTNALIHTVRTNLFDDEFCRYKNNLVEYWTILYDFINVENSLRV
jgi:hypothetical protein